PGRIHRSPDHLEPGPATCGAAGRSSSTAALRCERDSCMGHRGRATHPPPSPSRRRCRAAHRVAGPPELRRSASRRRFRIRQTSARELCGSHPFAFRQYRTLSLSSSLYQMRFAEVATYLDRMEATRSRNELVKTLAELYAKTSPDEIQPVTYLIQGRLVPFFEPVEIGMGEKLVIASIAQASTRPRAEVSALFNTLGDLGLVAERLSTGATAKTPSIT